MKSYTIYNKDTGEILKAGTCSNCCLPLVKKLVLEGQGLIEKFSIVNKQKIIDDKIIDKT